MAFSEGQSVLNSFEREFYIVSKVAKLVQVVKIAKHKHSMKKFLDEVFLTSSGIVASGCHLVWQNQRFICLRENHCFRLQLESFQEEQTTTSTSSPKEA